LTGAGAGGETGFFTGVGTGAGTGAGLRAAEGLAAIFRGSGIAAGFG